MPWLCLVQLCLLLGPLSLLAAPATNNYCSVPPIPGLDFNPNLKPNLLLMLDNSASMYDLAYTDPSSYCVDSTYKDSTSYPGYFDQNSIYSYDSANGRFVPGAALPAPPCGSSACAASTSYLYVQMAPGTYNRTVTNFLASGNFLNWLTMSKMDIEKKVLTGGKFQFDTNSTTSGTLIGETRGCQGMRFVKIAPDAPQITFAVRGPIPPSKNGTVSYGDSDYVYSAAYGGGTRIEIYDRQYNTVGCLAAVGDWLSGASSTALRTDATACIGSNNLFEADVKTPTRGKTYLDVMINCYANPTNVLLDGSVQGDCAARIGTFYNHQSRNVVKGLGDDVCAMNVTHSPTSNGDTGYLGYSYNYQNKNQTVTWINNPEGQAEDYCRQIGNRPLTDPSTGNLGGTNLDVPSFILDAGIYGIGTVSGTFLGRVYLAAPPTGLLQEFSSNINFGAMVFNDNGAGSECKHFNLALPSGGINWGDIPCVMRCTPDHGATFSATECYKDDDCGGLGTCQEIPPTDGGKVIAPVSAVVGDHTTGLIRSIDTTVANAWTPLAESFYDAIGYFAGRTDLRLQPGDFSTPGPAMASCQRNNILLVTDGTSTADRAPAVNALVASAVQWGMPASMTTTGNESTPPFQGSYNLDDLAWIARNRNIADFSKPAVNNRDFISTYVVFTGVPCGSYNPDGSCQTSDEGVPEKLMQLTVAKGRGQIANAQNPATLANAFRDSLRGISSGGATDFSILATGTGNGALYLQELLYPSASFDQGATSAAWIGEMQSLWYYIDPFLGGSTGAGSTIREDTDGDFKLNLKKDRIVNFGLDPVSGQSYAYLATDSNGDGIGDGAQTTETIDQLRTLWRAGQQLWARNLTASPRTIYTPLVSGGIQSASGLMQLSAGPLGSSPLPDNSLALQPYLQMPDQPSSATLIRYVQGFDFPRDPSKRSRRLYVSGVTVTADPQNTGVGVWKLGDITAASPQVQSQVPLGNYHLAAPAGYNDTSYAGFIGSPDYQQKRSQSTVYVGANDGMLHAFNLGTLDTTVSGDVKATLTGSNLGMEQWAFIPHQALPYLTYLTDPGNGHLYLLDGKLTLLDASIGDTNSGTCVPASYWKCPKTSTTWRSVLIGGMGQGGASAASCSAGSYCVQTPLVDPANVSAGLGYSSYFALDVTDPANPALLWEFNNPALGFSTTAPAIVRINDPSAQIGDPPHNGRWFAVFGSGPTGPIDPTTWHFLANSSQELKFFVVDLRSGQLVATIGTGIQNAFAGTMSGGAIDLGRFKGNYQDDAIYVGYSQQTSGGWTGGVLRILTMDNADPTQWKVGTVLNGIGPVTAGVARLQDRKNHNLWLYFGSGRYFFNQDDLPVQRAFYGVKDPCYTGADQLDPVCAGAGLAPLFGAGNLIDQSGTPQALAPTNRGWLVNLDPATGSLGAERVLAAPTPVTSGAVYLTTFEPSTDPCQSGTSYLWGVRYDTGGSLTPQPGKALVQLSTGSMQDTGLSGNFTDKGGRRGAAMNGRPSGVKVVSNSGLKPVKKIIHIQER